MFEWDEESFTEYQTQRIGGTLYGFKLQKFFFPNTAHEAIGESF